MQATIDMSYHPKTLKLSGVPLNNDMRLLIAGLNEKHTKRLSDCIEVTVGMEAMINQPKEK